MGMSVFPPASGLTFCCDEHNHPGAGAGAGAGVKDSWLKYPTQAQKLLGGMEHLAGKDKIVKRAEQNGADENALDVLRRIPDRQCDGSNVDSHEINGAN